MSASALAADPVAESAASRAVWEARAAVVSRGAVSPRLTGLAGMGCFNGASVLAGWDNEIPAYGHGSRPASAVTETAPGRVGLFVDQEAAQLL